MKEEKEKLLNDLARLDWILILDSAIKGRKTSWNENPVREWRNASDEIYGAVVLALKNKWKIK